MIDDHSHGLFYDLAAAVGRLAVLNFFARQNPAARVIPLQAGGLGLLPITEEAAVGFGCTALVDPRAPASTTDAGEAEAGPSSLLTGPESGFSVLTPELVRLFETGSRLGPVAYIEANYLGREGWQSAVVWRHGRVDVGPLLLGRNEVFYSDSAPISIALRALGLTAVGRRDEFVVAGLGRRRSTQEWADNPEDQP
jgi:hypothetical protein